MTTNTMVALRSTTLASSASSVTLDLTGITGYTDLVLVVSAKSNTSTLDYTQIQFNNDGGFGNLYSRTYLGGNGSSAYSGRNTSTTAYSDGYLEATASGIYAPTIFNIMNYANTTTYKTILSNGVSSNTGAGAIVGLWRNLNAINRIDVSSVNGNGFAAGSTFTLYGIANADIGAYATGGIITQDSTYYYHAFGSSGTFTPSRALTADILVVAGGGGGGFSIGGGGGAGGLLAFASQSLTSGTGYTCTVGAGGAGSTSAALGSNGGNSSFGSISGTVYGGGGGGNVSSPYTGATGGSGGGTSYTGGSGTQSYAGGTGTSLQGNNGGAGKTNNATYGTAGGGGGAGANGSDGTTDNSNDGGAGGIGISTLSAWSGGTLQQALATTSTGQNVSGTYYIAGGGGAGSNASFNAAGGYGGGGAGAKNAAGAGSNGLAYTGGGGGGGGYSGGTGTNGGSGGSGLIIVRYAK